MRGGPGVQWSRAEERRVWALRRRYPFLGKARLHILLEREGLRLSAFTVRPIVMSGAIREPGIEEDFAQGPGEHVPLAGSGRRAVGAAVFAGQLPGT